MKTAVSNAIRRGRCSHLRCCSTSSLRHPDSLLPPSSQRTFSRSSTTLQGSREPNHLRRRNQDAVVPKITFQNSISSQSVDVASWLGHQPSFDIASIDRYLAQGRLLLEACLKVSADGRHLDRSSPTQFVLGQVSQAAEMATRILEQAVQLRLIESNELRRRPVQRHEWIVQSLTRVLNIWKLLASTRPGSSLLAPTASPPSQLYPSESMPNEASLNLAADQSLKLLRLFHQAGMSTGHVDWFPSDKAYSMALETLAKSFASMRNVPVHDVTGNPLLYQAKQLVHQRLEAWKQQKKQSGFSPPPDLVFWNSYLNVMARGGYTDDAIDSVTILMPQYGAIPDHHSWSSLLNAVVEEGSQRNELEKAASRAQLILERMPTHLVNNIIYSICIEAWGRAKQPEKAEALLLRMCTPIQGQDGKTGEMRLRPDAISYLAAIQAWSQSRHSQAPERALALLERFASTCTWPSPLSTETMQGLQTGRDEDWQRARLEMYTTVMNTWAKRANSGPKVAQLLEQLENTYQLDPSRTVRPSLKTYTTVMRAWAMTTDQKDAPEQAERLLNRLEALGREGALDLIPCAVAYTTVIHAWAQCPRPGAPDRALELLNRMEVFAKGGRASVIPTVVTYNAVVAALVKHSRFDDARAILSSMEFGLRPDAVSYATIIHALANSRRPDAGSLASDVLEEMEDEWNRGNHLSKPTSSILALVVRAHGSSSIDDCIEQADNFFWELADRFGNNTSWDESMSTLVCDAVLKVWAKSRDPVAPERCQKIVAWMEKQAQLGNHQVKPTLESFKRVMECWARSGRQSAAESIEQIFRTLRFKYGINPDAASYSHLLAAINLGCRKGQARRP